MAKKKHKKTAKWMTLFLGVTLAYFIWLSWQKLTEFIGSSTTVWLITGGILALAIVGGYTTIGKILDNFR